MEIPQQLHDSKFRFVKVRPLQKRAFEIGWQKDKNYVFNDPSFLEHINAGGNYGVFCGNGGVLVVDADTPQMVDLANSKLPKTFTVKTRKGFHYYYNVGEIVTEKKPLKADNYHYGDFLGSGSYVVGCGSKVKSDEDGSIHEYTIENDLPITKIDYGQLKMLLSEFFTEKVINKDSVTYKDKGIQDLNIMDVVDTSGLKQRGNELQGEHPIHGSTGGMNFAVNPSKNTWHCYRCSSGGGALNWIAVKEGIISCEQAQSGGLRGEDFTKTLKIAVNKYNLKMPSLSPNLSIDVPSNIGDDEFSNLVLTRLVLRDKDGATELIVNKIMEDHKIYTIRDDEKVEVWIYSGGIYIPQGKTVIKEECRNILGKAYSETLANRVISKIETDTYIEQDEFFNQNNIDEIAVSNGLLNLFTGVLSEFTPNKIFFNKIPVKYDPTKTCPHIMEHFKAVLKDPENDIKVMEELFGYLLYKEYKIEKAFMFNGSGRNGKSKSLALMKAFIGEDNCVDVPLQQFDKDLYAQGELFKKMANLSGDLDSTALTSTGTFKKLVGRDLISAPRKFMTRIHFVNYAKLIFCANQLPRTFDTTTAFFHRWILFDFPYKFISQKEMDSLKDSEEKSHCKLMNPDIVKKITTPEELSGLLNVAIKRLQEMLVRGDFSYSQSTEEVKNAWIRKSDSFSAFLMDCVEEDWHGYVTKQDLRKEYAIYCKHHKIKMLNEKVIKAILTSSFGVSEERQNLDGERVNVWTGIQLHHVPSITLINNNNVNDDSSKDKSIHNYNNSIESMKDNKNGKGVKEVKGISNSVAVENSYIGSNTPDFPDTLAKSLTDYSEIVEEEFIEADD